MSRSHLLLGRSDDVRVESLHSAFAPVGTVVSVTRTEATALACLGRARVLTAETAPDAASGGGSAARSARPAPGVYNRSDMQSDKHARNRKSS